MQRHGVATSITTQPKLRQVTADSNKKVLLTFPFDSVAASATIVAHMKLALILPILSLSTVLLHAEQVNMVELGDKTFHLWGCAECHVTTKNDISIKTGPSLYNLFTTTPREIEVIAGEGGKKNTVKADRDYFLHSVRKPAEQLKISENGPTKGTAYAAIMPQFTVENVTDSDLEAIWHYLRHAADEPNAGPASVMAEIQSKAPSKNILENPAEIVVSKRPRVYRAPLLQSSGRAIHVGLPSGMNYTFDPRMLSVRKVWSGGFLNLEKEQKGRSTPGSEHGLGARDVLDQTPLLVPLTDAKKPIDLEFMEPDVGDEATTEKHLWKGGDFLKELASWDCAFLGYSLTASGEPDFAFRVGKNSMKQHISFSAEGWLVIEISGSLKTPQAFQVRQEGLKGVSVTGGTLTDGVWTLPAGEKTNRLQAKIGEGLVARPALAIKETFAPQALNVVPSKADLPPGYEIESWDAPLDTYGRKQLFEPTAMAVAKNGTLVVGTRTAGIWRLKDKKWELFAEGIFECLGLCIEDDNGDTIVIAQKPELTRIRDTNKDGRADQFLTVCDDYGFHGNYHEYTHGPVRDAEGNYYFTLNLCHTGNDKASYRAGGPFMGSMGGFRGWCCRVTPAGVFEPYASGLRSPAGFAMDPDGRLVMADNQGEYMGSSKISYVVKGEFYGHPSGLVSLPGMKPDSPEIAYEKWKKSANLSALWFPHGKYANSPGSPTWDLTKGKFGPYEKQMFIGDQTLSTLMRVSTEKVGDTNQGMMTLFSKNLASGVMRPIFQPDGSLLLGQTGRGWQSKGGNEASLQRIFWDGKTIAADIFSVKTIKDGIVLHFTAALQKEIKDTELLQKIKITSWTYNDSNNYGSNENEGHSDEIKAVTVSADRKSIRIEIPGFSDPAKIINRLYYIKVLDAKSLFGNTPSRAELEAYQTIRAIPK